MPLIISCSGVSSGILSESKMADILFDIHLAEKALSEKYSYGNEKKKQAYYNAIFEEHGVTKERFDNSLKWYNAHPVNNERIYIAIKERYTNLIAELETKEPISGKPYYLEVDTTARVITKSETDFKVILDSTLFRVLHIKDSIRQEIIYEAYRRKYNTEIPFREDY